MPALRDVSVSPAGDRIAFTSGYPDKGIWVFQNFLRDVMHCGPLQLGQLESLREIPGFLAALTTGTLVALAESRVAALGLLIGAVGIGATGAAGSYGMLVAITVFWSVGFHLWASMAPAITLALAKGRRAAGTWAGSRP